MMNFFDLQDIADSQIEILSPCTTEQLLRIGRHLKLASASRVIDFGCGKGELLSQWGKEFGVSGVGIDIRTSCTNQAQAKINAHNLTEKIDIVHGKVTEYDFESNSFDTGICIASSYTWGGFRESLAGMKSAIKPDGKLVIGEAYWQTDRVDSKFREEEPFFTETELLKITREENLDFEFMFRASREIIDNYESEHWRGFINWIEANPDHPEVNNIVKHLHKIQNEYFYFDRNNLGWAIYILNPVKYKKYEKTAKIEPSAILSAASF
ncbi:MAG: class I SAM-dependent methyltransferase [candidate division Zixibacteria bacterium]|nr:class I SAM-dependent methyltransferase [candidate division Zixibacteria bacterium]